MGWKLSKQRTMHPLLQIFNLLIICTWNLAKIDVVGRPQIERSSRKRNSPETVVRFGFCMYHESNECSIIGKTVIFQTFMNIWSTVDCIRKGYKQIGKPTFDLWQVLDRLICSHAPQTIVVRIFALWRLFKGVLRRCETSEDNCRITYW